MLWSASTTGDNGLWRPSGRYNRARGKGPWKLYPQVSPWRHRVGSLQGTFFRGPSYPHLSTNMENSLHWENFWKTAVICVNSGIFCTWHRIFWQAYASLLGLLARLNAAAQAPIHHLQARGHWKNCTLQELFSLNPAAVKSMSIRKYKVAHPATVRLEMPHNKFAWNVGPWENNGK